MMASDKVHALRRNLQGAGGILSIAWCTEMFEILHPQIVFESSFRTMVRYSQGGICFDRTLCQACADALGLSLP